MVSEYELLIMTFHVQINSKKKTTLRFWSTNLQANWVTDFTVVKVVVKECTCIFICMCTQVRYLCICVGWS